MGPGYISFGASRELETTSVPWLQHERNCPELESAWSLPAASTSSQQPLLQAVGSPLELGASPLYYSRLFHRHMAHLTCSSAPVAERLQGLSRHSPKLCSGSCPVVCPSHLHFSTEYRQALAPTRGGRVGWECSPGAWRTGLGLSSLTVVSLYQNSPHPLCRPSRHSSFGCASIRLRKSVEIRVLGFSL